MLQCSWAIYCWSRLVGLLWTDTKYEPIRRIALYTETVGISVFICKVFGRLRNSWPKTSFCSSSLFSLHCYIQSLQSYYGKMLSYYIEMRALYVLNLQSQNAFLIPCHFFLLQLCIAPPMCIIMKQRLIWSQLCTNFPSTSPQILVAINHVCLDHK